MVWAMLWRWSEGQVTREVFRGMTDWEKVNVVFRPGINDGDLAKPYDPVPRHDDTEPPGRSTDIMGAFYDSWRRRGLRDEEIEERFWRKNPQYKGGRKAWLTSMASRSSR